MANQTGIPLLLTTALAPLVWGSTYLVSTQLLPDTHALFAAMVRALPAGVILLLITRNRPQGQWWLKLTVLATLNIGLFFYCLFSAAYLLPGGMAALLMSGQPLLVLVLSRLLFATRFTRRYTLALLLGVLGMAMLVLNDDAALNGEGVLIGLLGTFSMATGLVLTKYWGRPDNMSLLGFTGWQLTLGGLLLLPLVWQMNLWPSSFTVRDALGYGHLCFVASLFGYLIWFRGIERLPAVTISFLGFLSSVSACLLGYLVLGEQLSLLQFAGGATILVAIYLSVSQSSAKQSAKLATENP
ncbi:EamA family transporter [Vibrio sp.]|uniref:EamA family transporter n=1 Tax=Vibrio sp. TaxID=678 RepID=UPI003D0F1018